MTALDTFYEMVQEMEVAMLTTRRPDGHLRSRAMATQKRAAGADLWFVAEQGSSKLAEIRNDPHVNLAFYKDRTREWISVSGLAALSQDRAKIRELYAPDWRMWFPDDGDPRHGTPDDPRMVLIGVTVHAAEFFEVNKSTPTLLYEMARGWLTGDQPDLGTMHHISPAGSSSTPRR